MKSTSGAGILLVVWLAVATVLAFGANVPSAGMTSPYQQGRILSVRKSEVQSPAYGGGDNPSDAPLHSDYYVYDVAVRVNCGTYVGRYDSPYDYFPSAFVPEHRLPVRLTRHVLYFSLPNDREMQMNIVSHKAEKQAVCTEGATP
jgi:hypothetical protein